MTIIFSAVYDYRAAAKASELEGTCQLCLGMYKLDTRKNLVHHGYQRPGTGEIVNTCPGAGKVPFEVSCDLTKEAVKDLEKRLEKAERDIALIKSGKSVVPPENVRMALDHLNNSSAAWWIQLNIYKPRIAAWKPLPLRQVGAVVTKVTEDVSDQVKQQLPGFLKLVERRLDGLYETWLRKVDSREGTVNKMTKLDHLFRTDHGLENPKAPWVTTEKVGPFIAVVENQWTVPWGDRENSLRHEKKTVGFIDPVTGNIHEPMTSGKPAKKPVANILKGTLEKWLNDFR